MLKLRDDFDISDLKKYGFELCGDIYLKKDVTGSDTIWAFTKTRTLEVFHWDDVIFDLIRDNIIQNSVLVMGYSKPVEITDSNSGILRRLTDKEIK